VRSILTIYIYRVQDQYLDRFLKEQVGGLDVNDPYDLQEIKKRTRVRQFTEQEWRNADRSDELRVEQLTSLRERHLAARKREKERETLAQTRKWQETQVWRPMHSAWMLTIPRRRDISRLSKRWMRSSR
jgi:hypothetical protein